MQRKIPATMATQHPDNALLENPRADHYVLGLRRRLTPSTRLTVETYPEYQVRLAEFIELFPIENGEIVLPQKPGLGMTVNEAAIRKAQRKS